MFIKIHTTKTLDGYQSLKSFFNILSIASWFNHFSFTRGYKFHQLILNKIASTQNESGARPLLRGSQVLPERSSSVPQLPKTQI